MRTKIRVDDKWYRPVPRLVNEECNGCAFENKGCVNYNGSKCCVNYNGSKFATLCDDGKEFTGMIFIPNTKEALAEYVLKRMGVTDDPELE